MNDNLQMQTFVKTLLDQGYSEEEVVSITANVAEEAVDKFIKEASAAIGENLEQSMESMSSDTDAMTHIQTQYQLKTGKDAQERLHELIQDEIASYLNDSNDPSSPNWQ